MMTWRREGRAAAKLRVVPSLRLSSTTLGAVALALALPVAAEPERPAPQVEVGAGAIMLRVPDYRGSDRYDVQAYPVPYVVYRSERVQVTREGVRARLFTLDRLTASLSAVLNLRGTDDNPDRAGMPQLDPSFEVGPSLDYLWLDDADSRVRLRMPVRAAVAADGLRWRSIGWVAVPHLRYDRQARIGDWNALYLASAGAVFATEDYHEYFYGVAERYADASLDRPVYDAEGGYSGARFNVSGTLHRDRWRFGAFVSCDWLDGAVFDDSPLTKVDHSLVTGLYVTFRLYASGRGKPLEGDSP
jgi:MipA family protein